MQENKSNVDILRFELANLEKLHIDLEKQMLTFDEIVPFERQTTAKIFSPRLLNIMLVCGAQIEAVTDLIVRRCNIEQKYVYKGKKKEKSVTQLIKDIDAHAVLSKMEIVSKSHEVLFSPFHLDWWAKYNELKHELSTKHLQINYTTVMDSLAALSGLYCLAKKLLFVQDEVINDVLDHKSWRLSEMFVPYDRFGRKIRPQPWESLIFRVNRICIVS
ncbi:MAG: hypothetical protein ACKO7N_10095 [Candidatus Nitrosotenuis sp.]